MKRVSPPPFDYSDDFIVKQVSVQEVNDDIEFYKMVQKINDDCISTIGEIGLYYKSKYITQVKTQNQLVVHEILEDLMFDVMMETERSDYKDSFLKLSHSVKERNDNIETLFLV